MKKVHKIQSILALLLCSQLLGACGTLDQKELKDTRKSRDQTLEKNQGLKQENERLAAVMGRMRSSDDYIWFTGGFGTYEKAGALCAKNGYTLPDQAALDQISASLQKENLPKSNYDNYDVDTTVYTDIRDKTVPPHILGQSQNTARVFVCVKPRTADVSPQ